MPPSTIRRRETPITSISNQSPLVARIYAARGITNDTDGCLDPKSILSPFEMGGMDKAARMAIEAIDNNQNIIISGDYDCDGATGTTVAVRGLTMLGAKNVRYILPDRFKHGYGLSVGLVNEIPNDVNLIITVDSGVSSIDGVKAAKDRGMKVLITDHHLPGDVLPDADAIINPNLKDDPFPSKSLAGVGVMFYLLIAIRSIMRERGDFRHRKEPNLSELLDIVAIGTIADLVHLDRNNRILISSGLKRIREGKAHRCIYALLEAGNKNPWTVTASDISFGIAPRLNAAGRIDNMAIGVQTLLSEDGYEIEKNVKQLTAINEERKGIQASMVELADKMVLGNQSSSSMGVVVFDQSWHSGIVGLVASKVKDTLHRPTFAFAPASPGSSELRGSGRSIPGFHLRDALAYMDAKFPGLIPKFGGHAMAAGMSLNSRDLEQFTELFDQTVNETLDPGALINVIYTDGPLEAGQITLETAHELRLAGPWGQGFPEPVFENDFHVESHRVLGGRHLKMVLVDPRDGAFVDAIMFFAEGHIPPPEKVHLVYELSVNEWQGVESVQLLIRNISERG